LTVPYPTKYSSTVCSLHVGVGGGELRTPNRLNVGKQKLGTNGTNSIPYLNFDVASHNFKKRFYNIVAFISAR
jgi:hypothetical protein